MTQQSREQKFIAKLEEARQTALRLSEAAAERERGLAARLHDAHQVALRMTKAAVDHERYLAAKLHEAQEVALRTTQAAAEREQRLAERLHDVEEVSLRTTQAAAEHEQSLEAKLHDVQQAAVEHERQFDARLRDLHLQLTEARAAVEHEQNLVEALRQRATQQANVVMKQLRDLGGRLEHIAVSHSPPPLTSRNGTYGVAGFEAYHGEAFVQTAYRALLRREPDAGGLEYYCGRLRQGITKIQILGEIRYSEEGRAAGVQVAGLVLPYALRKAANLPILGVIVHVLLAISYLLHFERKQVALESHLAQLTEQSKRELSGYLDTVRHSIDDMMASQTEVMHAESAFDDMNQGSRRSPVAEIKVEESASDM